MSMCLRTAEAVLSLRVKTAMSECQNTGENWPHRPVADGAYCKKGPEPPVAAVRDLATIPGPRIAHTCGHGEAPRSDHK